MELWSTAHMEDCSLGLLCCFWFYLILRVKLLIQMAIVVEDGCSILLMIHLIDV